MTTKFYLFNDAAYPQPSIYLSDNHTPVTATHATDTLAGGAGFGRTLAGTATAEKAEDALLASKEGITTLGEKFCAAMGVERSLASLTRFVSNTSPAKAVFYPDRACA